MKAIWKDTVIAESDDIVTVEGNAYFPEGSLKPGYFTPTPHHSACPWKGEASYLTITVGGEHNENAAWVYRQPKPEAASIKDRVAFWRGVEVVP